MSAKKNISIFWFRQDLRVADNPGLTKAVENGSVLPVYIMIMLTPKNMRWDRQVNGGFTIR